MNKTAALAVSALVTISTLSGCVVASTGPQGPSMTVLPGTGKTFAGFKQDDNECRQFARDSIGGPKSGMGEVVKALSITAAGAGLGAAIGGGIGGTHTNRYGPTLNAQSGTAIGVTGGAATAMQTHNADANNDQARYDHAYVECMYANHNKIPASAMR